MALKTISSTETVTKTSVRKSFISSDDVLMGRGARATENEGNVRFRQVVRSRLRDYLTAPRRQEKDQIAREILAIVKSRNGRFLRKVESMDESQGGSDYVAVEDDVALLKVKQALRDQKLEEANSVSSASDLSIENIPKTIGVDKHGLLGKEIGLSPFFAPKAFGTTTDSVLLHVLKEQARVSAAYPGLVQASGASGLAAARIAIAERELAEAALKAPSRDAILQAALLNQTQSSFLGLPSASFPLGLGPLNPSSGLLALEAEARLRLAQQASVQDLLFRTSAHSRARAGSFQELGDVANAQRLFKRQKI
mmetsp:Transcript_40361/g.84006  ORF Transcript_40361/g.84006 Transcript_40361/m.84006 type:complete len:310 (-) Transcript_40361:396-1325(-)|eukprot:CAMPEP_0172453494 /NCGR_PEP_ID=MMETSP1065-20121228/10789_1 /TAXON_ID=265537 /ORGANISM="Amphiprora paludosa, Strain CCMP125" /LENGTH=309 /DNA_ID=CAMNT_0013205677 /DNA_START=101 /DNA_END=1030 /DNA_ORIENTATION=-